MVPVGALYRVRHRHRPGTGEAGQQNLRLDGYVEYYYIVMPITLIGVYLAYSILRSDIGRCFKAIREDSLAAAASGVDVRAW